MRLRDLLAYLPRHKRDAVLATASALLAALVGFYAPLVARQAVNLAHLD